MLHYPSFWSLYREWPKTSSRSQKITPSDPPDRPTAQRRISIELRRRAGVVRTRGNADRRPPGYHRHRRGHGSRAGGALGRSRLLSPSGRRQSPLAGASRRTCRSRARLCRGGEFGQHPPRLRFGLEAFCQLVPSPGLFSHARPIRRPSGSTSPPAPPATRRPATGRQIPCRRSSAGCPRSPGTMRSAASRLTAKTAISPQSWPASATSTPPRLSRRRRCCPRI